VVDEIKAIAVNEENKDSTVFRQRFAVVESFFYSWKISLYNRVLQTSD